MVKKSFFSLLTISCAATFTLAAGDTIPDFTTWADAMMNRFNGDRYHDADVNDDGFLTQQEWLDNLEDEEEHYLKFDEADDNGDQLVTIDEAENYTRHYKNLREWYDEWIARNPVDGSSGTEGGSAQ